MRDHALATLTSGKLRHAPQLDHRLLGEAAVFLASDQARRITGQVLVVDSGQVFVR